jgi:hypothetical protein
MKTTTCSYCGKSFPTPRNHKYMHSIKPHWRSFCSEDCESKAKTKKLITQCAFCSKPIAKRFCDVRKSKHKLFFCSRSHNASYWNRHKTSGCRSSKLEDYIFYQIQNKCPNIPVLKNDLSLNLELDIYLPTLKLAFELNGIFHYEPIYGESKLERMKINDKQKIITCYEAGIELCVIDTSSQKHFTQKSSQKYLDIVLSLIEQTKSRQESAGGNN